MIRKFKIMHLPHIISVAKSKYLCVHKGNLIPRLLALTQLSLEVVIESFAQSLTGLLFEGDPRVETL